MKIEELWQKCDDNDILNCIIGELENQCIWISINMFFKITNNKVKLYCLNLAGTVEFVAEEENIIPLLKEYLLLIQKGQYNFFYKKSLRNNIDE